MNLREFLTTVVTGEEGWFVLALGVPKGEGWFEEWFKWPEEIDKIVDRAQERKREQNVYFSSYLFKSPHSTKENVLPTRTIQADLDEADIRILPKSPTVLVETSPGRHQGFWVLSEEVELDKHEILSRKLTYAIERCDKSGWPLGRKVRLPETLNHKYLDGVKEVKVVSTETKSHNPIDFELLPDVTQVVVDHFDETFISEAPVLSIGPQELLAKSDLSAKIKAGYDLPQKDRSAYLWSLTCEGFRKGLSREEVFWLAKHSANNKFNRLRYHADRELAKDVLRAERAVRSNIQNERTAIEEARKLQGATLHERRVQILNLVRGFMEAQGKFYHTPDDDIWYIRGDIGRPILVSPRSEYLSSMLFMQYGLNQVESEFQYVVYGIFNHARAMPVNAEVAYLSHFNKESNTVLLHTGRKDVLIITKDSVVKGSVGAFDLVFPWHVANEQIALAPPAQPWHEVLFGDCLDNVMGLERDEAMALLRTWVLLVLFRNVSVARPILTLLGQPGAGKTTAFKRIYRLLYGRHRSVVGITNVDDFDHAVTTDPVVFFDNVDSWQTWLPDRLAMSASSSDFPKRKLYTDKDVVILKRHAMVGLTAHNPKFGREDVADRLLMLMFHRLKNFRPEGEMLERITNQRSQLWGGNSRRYTENTGNTVTTRNRSSAIPYRRLRSFRSLDG